WLVACGSWQEYWHNNATFRAEFYSLSHPLWVRPFPLILRRWPWGVLHLLAVPVAVWALARALLARRPPPTRCADRSPLPLLVAFASGWLVQSPFIQSQRDYQTPPTLLLALTLVAGTVAARARPRWRWGWIALGLFAALCQPALAPSRLLLWGRCWREG